MIIKFQFTDVEVIIDGYLPATKEVIILFLA